MQALVAVVGFALLITGISINLGKYSGPALLLALLSFVPIFAASFRHYTTPSTRTLPFRFLGALLFLLLLYEMGMRWAFQVILRKSGYPFALALSTFGILLAAALVVLCWRRKSATDRVAKNIAWPAIIALCVIAVILRIGPIYWEPKPKFDVYNVLNKGAYCVLHGQNPYTMTYVPGWTPDGKPGIARGFPYFPLNIFLTMPSSQILGDARISNVLADLIAAWLVYALARKLLRHKSAEAPKWFFPVFPLVFLFQPYSLTVFRSAWTEPMALAFVLGSLLVSGDQKGKYSSAILLACAILVKQYLAVLIVPFLIARRMGIPHLAVLVLIVAAVCAPFFLAAPKDFVQSTFSEHISTLRTDSLSVASFLKVNLNFTLPNYCVLAGNILFAYLLFRFRARICDSTWLTAASALLLLANLLLLAKSFINYYYLAASLIIPLLCAFAFPQEKPAARQEGGSVLQSEPTRSP
jgi:hypothetical protein